MTTTTLGELTSKHGFDVLEHLEAEAGVPVHAGLQAQGDLFVIPVSSHGYTAEEEVPAAGVPVIEAIAGGHEHRVFASVPGAARIRMLGRGQDIAYLECTEPVFSLHVEHGATGIAPGSYLFRRQREQADEERLIAD
jgi:hypothetical protein